MESEHAAIGVQEGEILAGKYRIERVLGAGGMGMVVAARHIELDEHVAIKFLLPETLDNPEVVARFSREARAAVRIKSEHVARIIDVGRMASGAPYIVMEYLEGEDLASWLERRGALSVDQALDFVLQACEAIAAAHALGIIHRDLKPANLFVVRLGDGRQRVKVLDFGISKVLTADQSAPSITNTAALLGSPLYMPPEQMRSARNVDTRSDIWSLGVILHQLVAGTPPFGGATMPEVLTNVLEGTPPGLRALVPAVPEGLEHVVLRCLQ
jgi:serine/threonine-protein kinase